MAREKKKRASQPAADLNVALIKMACTRGEEEYEPRNVLLPSFFLHDFLTSHVLTGLIFTALNLLLLPRHLLFSVFVLNLFSFLYVSNPPPLFFLFLFLFSFLFLRRPSVYV